AQMTLRKSLTFTFSRCTSSFGNISSGSSNSFCDISLAFTNWPRWSRDGAVREAHPPQHRVVDACDVHQGDDQDREDLAEAEHELPPGAHLLPGALRHRLHDVGVAVGDVAAERDAEQEADDDQVPDVRREALGGGQDDE